jgi:hypothetical protein
MAHFTDKPCAGAGLTSYRYRGRYDWVMIGAKNQHDALREALRSVSQEESVSAENLEVWDLLAGKYVAQDHSK